MPESKKSRQTTSPGSEATSLLTVFVVRTRREDVYFFALISTTLLFEKKEVKSRRLLRIHLHSFETTPTRHNTHRDAPSKKIIMAPPKEFKAPEHTIPVDS